MGKTIIIGKGQILIHHVLQQFVIRILCNRLGNLIILDAVKRPVK